MSYQQRMVIVGIVLITLLISGCSNAFHSGVADHAETMPSSDSPAE